MKWLLLMISALPAAAVTLVFVRLPAGLSAYEHKSPCIAPLPAATGYSVELPPGVSKFADTEAAKAGRRDNSNPSEGAPILFQISDTVDERDITALVEILEGTSKRLPDDISRDRIDSLLETYVALQICDPGCASRFWEALRAAEEFKTVLSDHNKYRKLWSRIFCSTNMDVPDEQWLDLFRVLQEKNPL